MYNLIIQKESNKNPENPKEVMIADTKTNTIMESIQFLMKGDVVKNVNIRQPSKEQKPKLDPSTVRLVFFNITKVVQSVPKVVRYYGEVKKLELEE